MDRQAGITGTANQVLGSPVRLLSGTVLFVATVFVFATLGYIASGWPAGDAAYMVLLTIFSVGYGEVRPIDTAYLRALTSGTMVLGCTGMIVLTGALVQVFTEIQLRAILGIDRMQTQIDRLSGHVIIAGFGRIGVQLAKELQAARMGFVVIERDARKVADIRELGHLCLAADATEESALRAAGIDRAKVLTTVLPDDATNVFITLSARSLNPSIEIIARGEAPTTENKLIHAGANRVVLPTHIGAERIAEMILYPSTDGLVAGSDRMRDMKRSLHELGLELEMVTIAAESAVANETVRDAELRGQGAFFIVQIDGADGKSIAHPGGDQKLTAGDSVLLVVRGSRAAAGAVFSMPRSKMRAGRSFY